MTARRVGRNPARSTVGSSDGPTPSVTAIGRATSDRPVADRRCVSVGLRRGLVSGGRVPPTCRRSRSTRSRRSSSNPRPRSRPRADELGVARRRPSAPPFRHRAVGRFRSPTAGKFGGLLQRAVDSGASRRRTRRDLTVTVGLPGWSRARQDDVNTARRFGHGRPSSRRVGAEQRVAIPSTAAPSKRRNGRLRLDCRTALKRLRKETATVHSAGFDARPADRRRRHTWPATRGESEREWSGRTDTEDAAVVREPER